MHPHGQGTAPGESSLRGGARPAHRGRYSSVGAKLRDTHVRGMALRELSAAPQASHPLASWGAAPHPRPGTAPRWARRELVNWKCLSPAWPCPTCAWSTPGSRAGTSWLAGAGQRNRGLCGFLRGLWGGPGSHGSDVGWVCGAGRGPLPSHDPILPIEGLPSWPLGVGGRESEA